MINQRHCPYCRRPAAAECPHLALAVEGRDFVLQCVENCHGEQHWQRICEQRRQLQLAGSWSPEKEDFTWLETAFCDQFMGHLAWFGGLDHEWRSGPKPGQGGFWVLLWSRDPRQLWWELRDELERKANCIPLPQPAQPWQVWLSPR